MYFVLFEFRFFFGVVFDDDEFDLIGEFVNYLVIEVVYVDEDDVVF